MTPQQLHQAGQDSRVVDLYGNAKTLMDHQSSDLSTPTFGSRLRAARAARGLDLEACAHALKLPARVLRQLENDERDGIAEGAHLATRQHGERA